MVLIGKLFHDLSNCKYVLLNQSEFGKVKYLSATSLRTPCPPGISLNVVLQRTLPEFYLLSKNGKADAQICKSR